jgi:hypothetical protein
VGGPPRGRGLFLRRLRPRAEGEAPLKRAREVPRHRAQDHLGQWSAIHHEGLQGLHPPQRHRLRHAPRQARRPGRGHPGRTRPQAPGRPRTPRNPTAQLKHKVLDNEKRANDTSPDGHNSGPAGVAYS